MHGTVKSFRSKRPTFVSSVGRKCKVDQWGTWGWGWGLGGWLPGGGPSDDGDPLVTGT